MYTIAFAMLAETRLPTVDSKVKVITYCKKMYNMYFFVMYDNVKWKLVNGMILSPQNCLVW